MGYSNNKWRKILIILSIINLCFILFGRFSKVFASSEPTINDFPTMPELYTNQGFIIVSHSTYYYLCVLDLDIIDGSSIYNTVWYSQSGSNKMLSFPSDSGKVYYCTHDNTNTWTYWKDISSSNHTDRYAIYFDNVLISSVNIYYAQTSNIYFGINYSPFHAPHFLNTTEIENATNPDVIISRGDYSYNDYLYFHLLQINYTITENDSTIYYYSDKTFALNKDSKYYYTYENDTDNKHSYYSIPRSALGLDPNTSYLYVLTNSKKQINNSSGILVKDENSGIYDVIESDTANVITTQDSINDKIQNIDDTINNNTISNDTETNIEDSLNFDNQNQGLNNLNGGFFSRLTSMLSNLLGYNLAEDTSVNLPMPNSNKTITLHSKDIYDNVTGAIRLIINAFWVYIFTFYMWRFINKIYIAVSTGNILDNFSSNGEAITNNML